MHIPDATARHTQHRSWENIFPTGGGRGAVPQRRCFLGRKRMLGYLCLYILVYILAYSKLFYDLLLRIALDCQSNNLN